MLYARNKGLSLITFLYSISICVMLSGGILKLNWFVRKSFDGYLNNLAINRDFLSVRQLISEELKLIGFKGYRSRDLSLPVYSTVKKETNIISNTFAGVSSCRAFIGSCKSIVSHRIIEDIGNKNIKPGSNIIVLNQVAKDIQKLEKPMGSAFSPLRIYNGVSISVGDILEISDYYQLDRFVVTNRDASLIFHQRPENTQAYLSKAYGREAVIFRPSTIYYYIKLSRVYNGSNQKYYTLYREELSRKAMAIAEGVVSIEVNIKKLESESICLFSINFDNKYNKQSKSFQFKVLLQNMR